MSYETYKILHLWSIFVFLASMTLAFSTPGTSKKAKMWAGIASFLILVAGMGLMARLGISHVGSWPLWVKLKVAIWFILAVPFAILAKRMQTGRKWALVGLLALAMMAVFIVVRKDLFL